MDPSHDCIFWMSQTDFRTQTKHLRFPGLIQWGHLRQAFQGLFRFWEGLVVPKRTESLCGGFCVLLRCWRICGRARLGSLPLGVLRSLVRDDFFGGFWPSRCRFVVSVLFTLPTFRMVLALHPKISCSLQMWSHPPRIFSS